jgi:transposase
MRTLAEPLLRERLLDTCHDAHAGTDEIVRAAADLLMFAILTASPSEAAAVSNVALVTRQMNENARASYADLQVTRGRLN